MAFTLKKLKEGLNPQGADLSEERKAEIEKAKRLREEKERQKFKTSGVGSLIGKIQGRDPRADIPYVPLEAPAPEVAQKQELPTQVREPSFPGEVVTQEYFTPSAKRAEGFQPTPDQVIGTSPELEIEKEREKLLAEETPERRELDPMRSTMEKIPIIGGMFSALNSIWKTILPRKDNEFQKELLRLNPQQLRTAALTAIEFKEIQRGLTANEAFGAFVEGIPVIGSLAAKYTSTLETPGGNAREVISNIRKVKRQVTNIETNVKMGYLPVSTAQTQINDMELNVQKLESRLKMLINNSPSLKFNSDAVNTMETEILIVREKIFQSKLNILIGKIQDPDEMDLYFKSQETDTDLTAFEEGNY